MSMNVGTGGSSQEPDVMIDINTTPLIDVMLVLLVMLIITIPIQLHAVNLNMPVGNPPPPLEQPVVVTIDVDFDGTVYWNGELVPNRTALEERLVQAANQPVQPSIDCVESTVDLVESFVHHATLRSQRRRRYIVCAGVGRASCAPKESGVESGGDVGGSQKVRSVNGCGSQ